MPCWWSRNGLVVVQLVGGSKPLLLVLLFRRCAVRRMPCWSRHLIVVQLVAGFKIVFVLRIVVGRVQILLREI
jgi:hypothetical protein